MDWPGQLIMMASAEVSERTGVSLTVFSPSSRLAKFVHMAFASFSESKNEAIWSFEMET